MSEFPVFPGFPEEGLHFLATLADNNNREWFEANKGTYRDHLLEPAQAFVVALGERLKTLSGGITYDTRTNGSGSIMRIHRDLRFSKDKTPYNTSLRCVFWEGARKRMENPGFFIWVEPGAGGVFAGMHMFPKPLLATYRDAVGDEQSGADLETALKAVRGMGDYEIGGEHYKRVPRGFDADHQRADLLRYNGLYAMSPPIDPAILTTPDVVEVCLAHCRNMAPLHHWLVSLNNRAST